MLKRIQNIKGMVDIQSVMVGVIVSMIIAAAAIGSTIGVIRTSAVNTGKTTATTIGQALDSYYVKYGYYPSGNVKQALRSEDLLDAASAANPATSGVCIWTGNETNPNATLRAQAKNLPQHYLVLTKVSRTNDTFLVTDDKAFTAGPVKVTKNGNTMVPVTGNLPSWANNGFSLDNGNGDLVSQCF